jgi:hypothetical protein
LKIRSAGSVPELQTGFSPLFLCHNPYIRDRKLGIEYVKPVFLADIPDSKLFCSYL